MAVMSRHRLPLFSLCGVLSLLIGVLLFPYRIATKHDPHSQGIGPRQLQPEILVPNSTESPKSIAQVFGRRDHTWEFSTERIHTKRALSERFQCLVEKGKQYWEQGVLPAFDGQSRFPNPFFDDESKIQDELEDSGWTSDDDNSRLGEHWKEAFSGLAGGPPDDNTDVIRIFLDQSQDFSNDYGEQQATSASYHGLYIPRNAAIIMFLTVSPRNKVARRRVPPAEIPQHIPHLNQLSDLVWLAWDTLVTNPDVFRYYAVEHIFNEIAKPLMDEIFAQRRGGRAAAAADGIPWSQRLTFDLRSEEGKALFASPNGIAVNWLLIHHATVLGRREPRVTIFNPGGSNRCMIWDLVPEGGQGSFGEVEEEIPGVWTGVGG